MVADHVIVDTFGLGVARVRNIFGAYRYVRDGQVGVLRDDPQRRQCPRIVEVVSFRTPAQVVEDWIEAREIGRAHVCHFVLGNEPRGVVEQDYKGLGRRIRVREPLFVATIVNRPSTPDPRVRRVFRDDVSAISDWAGRRQARPEDLDGDDSPIRLYVAYSEGRPVGRVRSVAGSPGARWVADLYVEPEARSRGLGAALMATMLADDARLGEQCSVLLASKDGARLYPRLGYERAGTAVLFGPKKSPRL